jgi:WD40 repeat protein
MPEPPTQATWGVQIWDAGSRKTLFLPHQGRPTLGGVTWSPDGERVITWEETGGNDLQTQVHLWDAQTGSLLRTFTENRMISNIDESGSRLLVSTEAGLEFWDKTTGEIVVTLRRQGRGLWNPDGTRLLTSSGGGAAVWIPDLETLLPLARARVANLSLTAEEGQQFAIVMPDYTPTPTPTALPTVTLLPSYTPTPSAICTLTPRATPTNARQPLTPTPSPTFDSTRAGQAAATVTALAPTMPFNAQSTHVLFFGGKMAEARRTADGRRIILRMSDGKVFVYDQSDTRRLSLEHGVRTDGMALSPDDSKLATWSSAESGQKDMIVRIWDMTTGALWTLTVCAGVVMGHVS